MTAADLADLVRGALARAVASDVREHVGIGLLLIPETAQTRAEVARLVGVTPRAIHHSIEVARSIKDEELAHWLALSKPPPWSALVAVSNVSPRRRRALLNAWIASGAGVRELARAART